MIQLKVTAAHTPVSRIALTETHTDITQLHRQLGRVGGRVRQRLEEEAGCDYR